MKKLYSIAVVLLVSAGMFAQSPNLLGPDGSPAVIKARTPIFPQGFTKPVYYPNTQAVASFIMDYDSADAYTQWTLLGNYQRFIWDMNFNYDAAQGDTSLKYIAISFDTINDTYASPIPVGYAPNVIQSVRVDSIYFFMGQENNSGQDDTLIVKLMNVNANGYPSTTVYWADTIYFPTDIPHGTNWLQGYVVSLPVNNGAGFTIPSNGKQFQVRMEYKGNKQDTMGVIAGFGAFSGPCGSNPNATLAEFTECGRFKIGANWYKANSYSIWTQYATFGLLPTSSGANIYYDCDNSGNVSAGDGRNYIQNWNILTYVTIQHNTGMNEDFVNGIKLGQNFPNPAYGSFQVVYELENSANVKLEIMDVTGKTVATINEGQRNSGRHYIKTDGLNLQPGVYFYTLTADDQKLTKKMTVSR